MPAFICTACGMQYAPGEAPPAYCRVCEDERRYTPPGGQSWTTLDQLTARHFNAFRQHEAGLIGIGTLPGFAIGQRALLVREADGCVMWDCIPLATREAVDFIARPPSEDELRRAVAYIRDHWQRRYGLVTVG